MVAENMESNDSPPGFSRVANRAKKLINDHTAVQKVVEQATAKAKNEQERLKGGLEDLSVLLRMLKAWATRRYKAIPLRTMTMVLAAVLYFLLPLDFIPDFILGSGFLDDLAVIGFVIQSLKKDIDTFRQWESSDEDIQTDED